MSALPSADVTTASKVCGKAFGMREMSLRTFTVSMGGAAGPLLAGAGEVVEATEAVVVRTSVRRDVIVGDSVGDSAGDSVEAGAAIGVVWGRLALCSALSSLPSSAYCRCKRSRRAAAECRERFASSKTSSQPTRRRLTTWSLSVRIPQARANPSLPPQPSEARGRHTIEVGRLLVCGCVFLDGRSVFWT